MISVRVTMAFILAVVVLSLLAGVSVFTVAEADEPVSSPQEAKAANSIPVKGLEAQKMGSAAWNVTGTGAAEPVKSGHAINWAPRASLWRITMSRLEIIPTSTPHRLRELLVFQA